jgi:hypothetical protein
MAYARSGLRGPPALARLGHCKPVADQPETACLSKPEPIAPIEIQVASRGRWARLKPASFRSERGSSSFSLRRGRVGHRIICGADRTRTAHVVTHDRTCEESSACSQRLPDGGAAPSRSQRSRGCARRPRTPRGFARGTLESADVRTGGGRNYAHRGDESLLPTACARERDSPRIDVRRPPRAHFGGRPTRCPGGQRP